MVAAAVDPRYEVSVSQEAEPRACIIEIGGRSRALGGSVMLRLAEPFTVLVGRNAAGKSTLLHLINDFALHARAAGSTRHPLLLGDEFQCTAEIAGITYRYTASGSKTLADERALRIVWRERCVNLSVGDKQLWSTDAGVVTGPTVQILVPPFTGLLALDPSSLPVEVAAVAAAFQRLLRDVTLIPAGLPATVERVQLLFQRDSETGQFHMRGDGASPRLERVAQQLMHWHQSEAESFERVQTVLQRIGMCDSLIVKTHPEIGIAFIFLDEYDLAAASDGTLRVIEIVVALEMAAAGALVMIEEPETGIHPGLCDRIMAEIEAAAEDLQLIISTHSPRILDRVQYHQLRHIRRNGSTRIDALTPEQVKEVKAFLDHDGTLSDYVFSPDFAGEDDGIEAG
jgi:predicted ATPase